MQEKSWHEGYTFRIKYLTGNFAPNTQSGCRLETPTGRHPPGGILASLEEGTLTSQGESTGINCSRHGQYAIEVIAFVLQQFRE